MARRKSKRRRPSPLEECFGGWRVMLSDALRRELQGWLLERVESRTRELEESLNSDRQAIFRLLREPIVHEELRIRRLRIGDYRVLFEILVDDCTVRFLAVEHRRRVYRDLTRRWQ